MWCNETPNARTHFGAQRFDDLAPGAAVAGSLAPGYLP